MHTNCDERSSECEIYESHSTNDKVCVSKKRIKKFQSDTIAPIIKGKNNKDYKLLETKLLHVVDNRKKLYKGQIYYYIFLSVQSGNIYILFSTGESFKQNIHKYIELGKFLAKLVNDILTIKLMRDQKIIICGHSLGCVLSLYTGMILHEMNPLYFSEKCVIVGSAPFKFTNNVDTSTMINKDSYEKFSNLKNVKIFVIGYFYEDVFYIDALVNNDNGENDYSYEPFTYIGYNKQHKIDIINDEDIHTMQSITDTNLQIDLHQWKNYYKTLSTIYSLFKGGGGGRKKTKKMSRKKMRRTIKPRTIKSRTIKPRP
jgi:hypothetical protein